MASGLSERLGVCSRDERKLFGMANGVDGKIDVERWPIKMVWRRQLNFGEFADRRITKPRKA